jgi:hypothetical protein
MKTSDLLARAIAIASLLGIGLGACSTATPYQPDIAGQRVSGGYSESRLADDRYRVNFAGNSLTTRDRVEGYLLYRAAELTVADGYEWFLIVDRHTEHDLQTYVAPDPFYRPWYGPGYGYWRPHWRYYRRGGSWHDWHPEFGDPFWGDHVDVRTVEKFDAEAEIVMRRGPVPPGEERAFVASKVMEDLGPTVKRPKARGD